MEESSSVRRPSTSFAGQQETLSLPLVYHSLKRHPSTTSICLVSHPRRASKAFLFRLCQLVLPSEEQTAIRRLSAWRTVPVNPLVSACQAKAEETSQASLLSLLRVPLLYR